MPYKYNMITILGATASGKTALAAHIAHHLNGEIISADSRQVYRGMDIGTGKDLQDYIIDGYQIPFHLIDIVDAGYRYNVYEYQKDFIKAFDDITNRNKYPVLCGGSGLYLEAVLKGYRLIHVPVNDKLREELAEKTMEELSDILSQFKLLHNTTDIDTKKRAIRAIEIEYHYKEHEKEAFDYPKITSLNIGVKYDRDSRRKRITERLSQRIDEGMIDEVKKLIDKGVHPNVLKYYGLEYKLVTQHVLNEIGFEDMLNKLNTSIHQFSKRQMTWFRKMENNGIKIHWLDGYSPIEEKKARIQSLLEKD